MKRVNVPRLNTVSGPGPGSEEATPLIITTGQQIQSQPGQLHAPQSQGLGLHENPSHQATIIVSTQQVINYSKSGALQYAGTQYVPPKSSPASHMAPPIQHQPRHKGVVGTQSPGVQVAVSPLNSGGVNTYQRLKVEDALSYLDQVKYKFNNQPQVYNDFLDIMKEFKSQSIDTPGVIARVSNLFKGHPELIVGFNTFLPPGYKIEVQANDQGYAYQVSVSMPSPNSAVQQGGGVSVSHGGGGGQQVIGGTGILVGPPQTVAPPSHPQHNLIQILPGSTGNSIVHTLATSVSPSPSPGSGPPLAPAPQTAPAVTLPSIQCPAAQPPSQPTNTLHHISQAHQQLEGPSPHSAQQPVEFNHAIEYVNKIKSRFSKQPEKYKRFLEILHKYQREQKELKEQPQVKQQTEQEVYAQVAKLFENQNDLLTEFGQFLPDATGSGNSVSNISSATIKSAVTSLENNRSQDAVRPRTTAQSQQRGGGGMDPMLIENETNFHSVSARPASPGYVSTVTTGSIQSLPPRSQDASLPSHHPPSHHLQKHSTSHHSSSGLLSSHHLKRSPSYSNNQISSGAPPTKKHKLYSPKDVSLAVASQYATLADYSYFDRVRKVLRSQEVYDNFIRCLMLFTNEIISKSELLVMTAPFFSRHPEFQRWMQDFLGPTTPPPNSTLSNSPPISNGPHHYMPPAPAPAPVYTPGLYSMGGERYTGESDTLGALGAHMRQERPQGDAAMDIDLSTCKRLGTSYCALPKGSAESAARRCSGRTALCREVLNDSWVSFPTWAEDSTFVTSRKTQYEEYIYRCEDERFELDVVIETNASTILALEGVHKKLCRMTSEDAQRFRLDDCLGGSSPTIHQRALRRIYGEKAPDIIAGLKKNPLVAVPVVLRRLKSKEEEWREAQKGFNKQWREQNEKYYLKSLDHQGINFKQNDLKALRSKSLINEIEALYEERKEQVMRGQSLNEGPHPLPAGGPHLCALGIGGATLLTDATDLLIHHVRRQTAVQKQEKQKIKQILKHFLPDLFCHPRIPLSDDERDDDEKDVDLNLDSPDSVNEDSKPAINSCNDKDVDMVDKTADMKACIKQEKDIVSSESDSNTSPLEKMKEKSHSSSLSTGAGVGGNTTSSTTRRQADKLSNKENKENIKSRNNSAEEADDTSNWSKSNDNPMKVNRRREGSSDSSSSKVKLEQGEMTSSDIMFSSLNSLHKDKWNPPSTQGIIFYGSAHWYVFLRLYSALCQRLSQMKQLAEKLAKEEEGDSKLRKPATAVALKLKPDNTLPVTQYYSALLEMVRSVLDGNMEATAYEDGLREMFGIHAFVAFTLDKIVSSAVRQLQQCVQERVASRCVDLHLQERTKACVPPNVYNPVMNVSYQRKAEKLLKEEHAFKMCIYGGEDCRVTFELLESGGATGVSGADSRGACSGSGGGGSSPQPVSANSHSASSHITLPPTRLADWDMYRERFANPGDSDTEFFKDENIIGRKAVFLPRNVRKVQQAYLKKTNGIPNLPAHIKATKSHNKSPSPGRDDGEKIEPTPINKQPYIHTDMQECIFTSGFKPTFVTYKDKLFYKCDSLESARKSHKKVTLQLDSRWQSWLRVWCSRHVTAAMSRGCAEWLKRGARAVARGSPTSPPYRSYTTYCLLHHATNTQQHSQSSPNSNSAAPSPTPVSTSNIDS